MSRVTKGILTIVLLATVLSVASPCPAMHCEGGQAGCEAYATCYEIQVVGDYICTVWAWGVYNTCSGHWEVESGIECLGF